MAADNADDLVPFHDVTVVKSGARVLLCRIGESTVCQEAAIQSSLSRLPAAQHLVRRERNTTHAT
jgi:hypothetical protein